MHKCEGVLDGLLGGLAKGDAEVLSGAIAQLLERVVFVGGDWIIREGEEAEGMFFVASGCVAVVDPEGVVRIRP